MFSYIFHTSSPPLRLYCGVNGLAADPSSKFDKDWRRINLPAAPPQDRVDRGAAHYKYQNAKIRKLKDTKLQTRKKIFEKD